MSTAIMPTVVIKRWDLDSVADTTLKVGFVAVMRAKAGEAQGAAQ